MNKLIVSAVDEEVSGRYGVLLATTSWPKKEFNKATGERIYPERVISVDERIICAPPLLVKNPKTEAAMDMIVQALFGIAELQLAGHPYNRALAIIWCCELVLAEAIDSFKTRKSRLFYVMDAVLSVLKFER